jgi:hypothetical protein
VTKESVALSIKIKPQINKISNFVKLETEIKIGDIVSNGSVPTVAGVPVFTTQDRTAKTTVVVGDSDTIVIGGLIRDKTTDQISKIPILGDIPVLGWLFKSKNTTVEKSNLLVFLTPHIVRQYEKVRAILDRKLKDRDDFIEREAGGDDPMRSTRDEMIRSLPDLKDITAKRFDTSVSLDEDKPGPGSTENGNPFTGGGATTGGSNPAPVMPQGQPGVPGASNELKVPQMQPGGNTGAAEPTAPLPPAPGAVPAQPPHPGSGT